MRSKIRRNGRDVMHLGILPEIPFQSAIITLDSLLRLQIAGEMDPFMYPVRCARWKIGSSDSPRRFMSATRLVTGSQLTPYHLLQQSLPVHDLKMPK
ncbi:hypothetical protein HanRHA438_Chr14g0668061 [Helianthus annuus]|nr:hypothetical protein HanRHA438_Chr14g0668061 [Helianthus annuus]